MGVWSDLRQAFRPRETTRALARGAPAPPERLGADSEGPPVGAAKALLPARDTSYQLVRRLAIDASITQTIAIFARADFGHTWDLFDLFDDGLLRDSRLDAVSRKRVLAIMSRPWVIEPPDDLKIDREATTIASNCKAILSESPFFLRRVAHLGTGTLAPFAVSPLDWRVDSRGWYVPALDWAHGNEFGFMHDTRLGFRLTRGGVSMAPLEDYPDCFVVHAPMGGRSTYPWRMGALRTRILPSMVKRNGVRWWAMLLERWGQPQVWANQRDGDSNDTAIITAFKQLSEYWQAVFPDGVTPSTLPMSGTISSDAHAKFVELANTDDAITILGQNLTTEVQGGSFAATEAHRFVADDILHADLAELGETLTQQVLEPIVRYNWPGAPVPRFRFVGERAAQIALDDVNAGLFTDDEYRGSKGYAAKPDGAGGRFRTPLERVPPATIAITGPDGASAGGGGAPPPFAQPSQTTASATHTQTSGRSTHPLARALSQR